MGRNCLPLFFILQRKLCYISMINKEFTILCLYITSKSPTQRQQNLYNAGIQKLMLNLSENEERILKTLFKYNFLLPFIDCGLSLFLRKSSLRKRFVLANSIIECNKENIGFYLNKKATFIPSFNLLFIGIKSILIMTGAYILFKIKGWK